MLGQRGLVAVAQRDDTRPLPGWGSPTAMTSVNMGFRKCRRWATGESGGNYVIVSTNPAMGSENDEILMWWFGDFGFHIDGRV